MSIEGMRLAWRELVPALDGFYEIAEFALVERQRLDEGRFEELDPFVGRMLEASSRIRGEAEGGLSEARGANYQLTAELLLAVATLDAVLASDLAAVEPKRDAPPRVSDVFDGWTMPSPREVFAEGQEALGQVAVLFDGIPAVGGGEHRPRSRPALIGDTRDAVTSLLDLAASPATELSKGFWSAASVGVSELFGVAERVDVLAKLQRQVEDLMGRAPKFLREHIAKIATLCPDSWFVDEATSSLADRLSARNLLNKVAASESASEVSRSWIEEAPRLSWPAIDDLRHDLDNLEANYKKHMKWIRKSARALRFGAAPLSRVAVASLGPAGYTVLPGVFALSTGYVAYSLTDRLDARDLHALDLIEGVVKLVERHIEH